MEALARFPAGRNGAGGGAGCGDGYGDGWGDGGGAGCGDGDGDGDGYGDGEGAGYGNGYGHGDGEGDGYGDGEGAGYGNGYGWGAGNGAGNGDGDGYGYGWGAGNGDGDGISRFCGKPVHEIDGVPTIILRARGNFASGEILRDDMTTEKTWVAKSGGLFAHGETARKAAESLSGKIAARMGVEWRIAEFARKFPSPESHATHKELFAWHGALTGSCEQGRLLFCRKRGLDPDSDETMSVEDFMALTRDEYGGDAIRALEKAYEAAPRERSDGARGKKEGAQ